MATGRAPQPYQRDFVDTLRRDSQQVSDQALFLSRTLSVQIARAEAAIDEARAAAVSAQQAAATAQQAAQGAQAEAANATGAANAAIASANNANAAAQNAQNAANAANAAIAVLQLGNVWTANPSANSPSAASSSTQRLDDMIVQAPFDNRPCVIYYSFDVAASGGAQNGIEAYLVINGTPHYFSHRTAGGDQANWSATVAGIYFLRLPSGTVELVWKKNAANGIIYSPQKRRQLTVQRLGIA